MLRFCPLPGPFSSVFALLTGRRNERRTTERTESPQQNKTRRDGRLILLGALKIDRRAVWLYDSYLELDHSTLQPPTKRAGDAPPALMQNGAEGWFYTPCTEEHAPSPLPYH